MAQGLFLIRSYAGDRAATFAFFVAALMPADDVAIIGRGDGDFGRSGIRRVVHHARADFLALRREAETR